MLDKIPEKEFHQSMRGHFAGYLYNAMIDDPTIWVVTADLGFGMLDLIKRDFPDRFLNGGASEQACADICVGLALEGKKPFFYSITPFLIYRCFETLRTYIDHENIAVRLAGSGRDDDYKHDGWSHDATDAKWFLGGLNNIQKLWPETIEEIPNMVDFMLENNKPSFISLRR